mgnify:CR=1 FL=1
MSSESNSYRCDRCGGLITIGSFPFCKGSPEDHGKWSGAETPCEEFVDEHITPELEGMKFTSRRAWVREMDKRGHVPATFKSISRFETKTSRGPTGKLMFIDMGKK